MIIIILSFSKRADSGILEAGTGHVVEKDTFLKSTILVSNEQKTNTVL